ncbi:MAG: MarR family EPS-associated transcriptional regulator, partial [Vicinamibacterales bacterium]
ADVARLAVLRLLATTPDLSQRALSERLGLSLGKAHYVLHALLDKGQVKVRNFRRSDRKLAYAYVLTPTGLSEKLRLTKRFLLHKEAEFEALKQTIDALRGELNATVPVDRDDIREARAGADKQVDPGDEGRAGHFEKPVPSAERWRASRPRRI